MHTEILKCADPDAPDNGDVAVDGNDLGDTATYICDAGFDLIGKAKATCTEAADGESASFIPAPPVCEGKWAGGGGDGRAVKSRMWVM